MTLSAAGRLASLSWDLTGAHFATGRVKVPLRVVASRVTTGGRMPGKRRITTKDVALLLQLQETNQLRLAPEFQRNAVWPRPAKAYLIDTILCDRPIPVLYFQRGTSAQTGRTEYTVIDGQQRLRAVLDFVSNRFSLTESGEDQSWYGKRWKALDEGERQRILDYDFVVEELSGYNTEDIRDMFTRMNRYVVPLNQPERRHASEDGRFKEVVESIGAWSYWIDRRIFSSGAANRRRTDEFAAELIILLIEGPQDKKQTVSLYYSALAAEFPGEKEIQTRLQQYIEFVDKALPDLKMLQLRRPANFYALIGALDSITAQADELKDLSPKRIGEALKDFNARLLEAEPDRLAGRYLRAASRQTDNLQPRQTRIEILSSVIDSAR